MAPFRRPLLQTRFFETGDNFYLGMEFMREYDTWKRALVDNLTNTVRGAMVGGALKLSLPLPDSIARAEREIGAIRGTFDGHINRLWYDDNVTVL